MEHTENRGQSMSSECWTLDVGHSLRCSYLSPDVWFSFFFFLVLVKALAVQGQYCVLRKRHIDWQAVSLQRKDNDPTPGQKKVWALYTINPPPAWPVHHYEMSFSSGFLCPPPPSLKWPIPSAPIFVCRPARLVYFTAIPSTSPSRFVVSHCFSASVGNRRNHRCRLLGPQQRWGAV